MKRLGGIWTQVASFENLLSAYRKARRGKCERPEVARVGLDVEGELLSLQRELLAGDYHPGTYRLFTLYERKPRLIAAAPFRDRVVHHAVMNVGVVLFAAGGVLRIWPVFVLGRRFSGLVAVQPGHTLVTSGAYGAIRHPSYLGLLVNSLGCGFLCRNKWPAAGHRVARSGGRAPKAAQEVNGCVGSVDTLNGGKNHASMRGCRGAPRHRDSVEVGHDRTSGTPCKCRPIAGRPLCAWG